MSMDSAPEGWEGTVVAMKSRPEIDNPYALAWYMKGEGMKPHDAMDSGRLGDAIRSYKDAMHLLQTEDGESYTQGQPRGPEPGSNVDLLQAEEVEPIEREPREADSYDDETARQGEDPDADSKRGHPVYGAAQAAPAPEIDDSDLHMLDDPDNDGDEHEQETEDDEYAELEAALAEEETQAELNAPTSQATPSDPVTATGKAHGTSSVAVEDPEPEEPIAPEQKKGPPVDPK